ncbi:glycosyl hydrolase family 95 catalytic domain-containing protein [Streptomyces poriferorum]|uniref:Glycoside hydrolase N-terminal domain-containing protein n=1 Tax=Streptomyces poriferorum TaxID=2798799 RepID=A0ABY9J101_9ACTN|nr:MULTISPECIES: glycoside hydrolase N-terminal domain-containing protein [unclassified Streptomyces]MDP5309500.1 glycoside hydrolase N-terminal domain-containing protein [Streptomyces sp. Alt4]WLQ61307.1 glycoside hydrolase N-terminal domain-containing protein [Streptomyces sp. Alt2]
MSRRTPAQHPAHDDPGMSRRGVLRAAASMTALVALSSLPEFTGGAVAVARPDALSLVPEGEAVTLRYSLPGAGNRMTEEGLPIGNGRLGALVTGDPSRDTMVLADATLWTGHANAVLQSDGQFPYGTGDFGTFGTLAETVLEIPAHALASVSDYRRTLDMSNGLVTASYRTGGVTYRREVFSSHPDDAVVIRLTQSGGGSYEGSLTLSGTRGETVTANSGAAEVSFSAALPNTLKYATVVRVAGTGGTVSASGAKVTFSGCSEVVLVVSGGTNYKADPGKAYKDTSLVPLDVARMKATRAAAATGTALLATHVSDFQPLQQRMAVNLGTSSAAQRAMDTPARLTARAAAGSAPDPELEASYLQFGRYLTICGSRGSLPTNLQGLWIDTNAPSWMSDYHSDINVQMNYWLPDRAGLPECFDAFTEYCLAQLPGWRTATENVFQDSRNRFRNTSGKVAGWTLGISTNIWGGNGWWWHPAGNAWMCNSLYEHCEFTQDTAHLTRIYPLLKGACEFWEARLITMAVPDPVTGGTRQVLVDDHDWSPEHGPQDARGITYTQELVRQLFLNYRTAAAALGRDAAYASTVAGLQDRLYLPEVSATSGRLEEWMSDDDLGETTHRHLSPLIGLFPGDRIAIEDSPAELVTGATKLLEARGMASFGWASAWRAICWAKLKHADKAYELVLDVLRPSVNFSNGSAINLFDMYSFGSSSVFQIDANFGTPVAMIQMLVQSRPGRVELLPALPRAWAAAGSITGVGVRGGFTLDMRWKDGQVTDATLRGAAGRSTDVVFGEWSSRVTIPAAGSVTVAPPAQHSVFQLVNRRSGKAVDVPGASTANGTGLIQYTPSSAVNQQFRFIPVGSGRYEIYTTHGSTPLIWAVWGGVSDAGAKVTQWTPEHSTSQQWTIADAGDGHVTLTCVRSGKVLGVTDDSDADGAAVEQQEPDGGTGQQWRRVGR